jgi:Carboxypeptidase regulatory-like domain
MQRNHYRAVTCAIALAFAGWLFPVASALAQVGATTDIVTGKVTGPDKQPITGATVTVTSIDTHISRSHLTNSDGRYTVIFPDGGGQYRVQVKYIGYAASDLLISRQADEDRLVANIEMSTSVHQLETVTTRGRTPTGAAAANAGSTGLTLTP